MTTYQYACDLDGPLEVDLAFGTAPPGLPCPRCGRSARRVFTAPLLGLGNASARALLDHTERSRSEPDVVAAPPPRRGRPPTPPPSPLSARLPRP